MREAPQASEQKLTLPALTESLVARRAAHPDSPALKFDGITYTWDEYASRSMQVANGLLGMGLSPGARVALLMHNRPEFLFTYLGLNAARLAAVPINTQQRGAALKHILSDSGAEVVVIDAELVPVVLNAWPNPPFELVVVDGSGASGRSFSAFDAEATKAPFITDGAEQPVGILYTSGTTGPPKGVVADGYDLRPAENLMARVGAKSGETIYTCLPLFHGNALMLSAMGAITNDWVLALGRRFSASRFWDEIRTTEAVSFNALGAMIPILLKGGLSSFDTEHRVSTVISAACPEWAWREFERRFEVRLIEFYGMVDSPGLLVNDGGPPGAMGAPVTGVEFRIVDGGDSPMRDGEIGELVFRHPAGQLTHYHNNPSATAEAYRGGWFHSGDLARRDETGYFYFCGRKETSMRRRGENISAWEIENAVNQIDCVVECAAHGVSSELGEDEVKIVVVLKEDATLSPSQLIQLCEGRIATYAIPRYVEFRSQLPKTATHRVRYADLKNEGVTDSTWDREQYGSGNA